MRQHLTASSVRSTLLRMDIQGRHIHKTFYAFEGAAETPDAGALVIVFLLLPVFYSYACVIYPTVGHHLIVRSVNPVQEVIHSHPWRGELLR